MYANFYHNEKCLYSIKVKTEKEAEHIADIEYLSYSKINDWTLTEKPISKEILA